MSGVTNFPTFIDADQSNVDNQDIVYAADVNNLQKSANAAQIALGGLPIVDAGGTVTQISDAMGGNPIAEPNVLGGHNGAITNFPYNGGVQIGWASVISTMIRRITGQSSYRTSPAASIGTILAFPLVTNGAVSGLSAEVPIASIINAGDLSARPAAAAGNDGWVWLVTSGGTAVSPNFSAARSNGTNWINQSFMVQGGSFAQGDLAKYNASTQQWERLTVGAAGQVVGVSGSDVAYITPSGVMITSPAVYNPTSTTWTLYSTIQGAITAAVSGQFVVIPPGNYTENVTLKSGVFVSEMIPGTVGIISTLSSPAVITATNSALVVNRISTAQIIGGTAEYPIHCTHTSGSCFIQVRNLTATYTTAASANGFGIRVNGSGGNTVLIADTITVTITGATGTAIAISNIDGTLNARVRNIVVTSTGDATAIKQTSAGPISVELTSATITSSAGNAYLLDVAGTTNLTLLEKATITGSGTGYGIYTQGGLATVRGPGTITATTLDIYNASGSIYLHGVQFSIEKTSGSVSFLEGDREPIGNPDIYSGRLTLTTALPVTTADVTAATTVYFTPHYGNRIALYHGGSVWNTHVYAELSIGVTSSQTGTHSNGSPVITGLTSTAQLTVGMEISGTGVSGVILTIDSATQVTSTVNSTGSTSATVTFKIPASKVVDIFIYDGAGSPGVALAFGPLWTNATTRATAITHSSGVRVLTGAYSIAGVSYAEGQLRYLGTVATTTTAGETEDSLTFRGVWNQRNKEPRMLRKVDASAASYAYASATWRQSHALSTNKVSFVTGIAEEPVYITFRQVATGIPLLGIAMDSTTVPEEQAQVPYNMPCIYNRIPTAGYHDAIMLEASGSGSSTFYGTQAWSTEDCLLQGRVWG